MNKYDGPFGDQEKAIDESRLMTLLLQVVDELYDHVTPEVRKEYKVEMMIIKQIREDLKL